MQISNHQGEIYFGSKASSLCLAFKRVLAGRPQVCHLIAIRDSTYSGRPLGSAEFTRALEKDALDPLTADPAKTRAQEARTRSLV